MRALIAVAKAAITIGLAASLAACIPGTQASPEVSEQFTQIRGHSIVRTLDEMAELSDAVVIGVITEELGQKQSPGVASPGEEPKFDFVFKDYQLKVERFVHPASTDTRQIAILTQAGIAPRISGVQVKVGGEKPEFKVGDRVLLFLEQVSEDVLSIPGHFVPPGYTQDNYYRVIVAGNYGKLVPSGTNEWKDSRVPANVTAGEVTTEEVEQAIARAKPNPK